MHDHDDSSSGGGDLRGGAGCGGPRQKLPKGLNLTADQQSSVRAPLAEAKGQRKGLGRQSRDLRAQLADAVRSGDQAKIDSISKNLVEVRGQMTAIRATAKSKIYAVLDADQKAKFDRRAKKRQRG